MAEMSPRHVFTFTHAMWAALRAVRIQVVVGKQHYGLLSDGRPFVYEDKYRRRVYPSLDKIHDRLMLRGNTIYTGPLDGARIIPVTAV